MSASGYYNICCPKLFTSVVGLIFPKYAGYLASSYMGASAGLHTFLVSLAILIAYYLLSADESLSEQKKKDIAEAVSYMLCKRYGFREPDSEMRTPEHMKNLTPKKARNELGLIRNAFNEIHERMYAEIEKKRTKNQERQEER